MKAWFKSGAPWVWLNGGAVTLCMIMVVGLLGLIAVRGFGHFWPSDILQTTVITESGEAEKVLGELVRKEVISAEVARTNGYSVDGEVKLVTRFLIKEGNRDLGADFSWYLDVGMGEWTYPDDATAIERREWGNFYGFPVALYESGQQVAHVSESGFWQALHRRVERSVELHEKINHIEEAEIGEVNHELERLRLEERRLQLEEVSGAALAEARARIAERREMLLARYAEIKKRRDAVYEQLERDSLEVVTIDGLEKTIGLDNIVRVTRPNHLSVFGKLSQYLDRFWAFLTEEPREANTEGGIFPAIFGTVTMVLVMSIMVTPLGVLAAIYLREYAHQGTFLKLIRISVYNLAGVPSIVYGVFGLGFFVYFLGGNIDELFFPAALPAPTFGTPGLFWASLTLALLTLPVVIVSTEEGLARIPSTIRQGSLALGATKSETLWKVVVPLATPGMMTGLILAIARAAGEVAPLMLVGVVKLAPSLPVDGNYPYLHLDQKIMHLGFHIYDVGFQSPNVEAARPLVYATALTLVMLIIVLNLAAIKIRNSLREKYRSASD